jgi:hypothetical protein
VVWEEGTREGPPYPDEGDEVSNEISEVTRRAIVDYIVASNVGWAGRLPEDDFLARLYDLTTMSSIGVTLSQPGRPELVMSCTE